MKLRGFNVIFIIIIIIGSIVIHNIQLWLDFYFPPGKEMLEEMMYFPSGRFLRGAICGFDILVANFVWLRAIQYYGQHVLTDRHYPWLAHIFNILITLDPKFINAHRFGGVLVSEDAAQPHEAIRSLKKVVMQNPGKWEAIYDIGFIYYCVLKDYHQAGKYFKLASLYEGPAGRSIRFAAHSFRKAREFPLAKNLWMAAFEVEQRKKRKELILKSYRHVQIDEDIERLQKLVEDYRRYYRRMLTSLDELVKKGMIDSIPAEPFGGKYIIQKGGIVTSTTLLYDNLIMTIRAINRRIIAFKAAKGRFPENLKELVKDGFIDQIPKNPFGIKYIYDSSNGQVLEPPYEDVKNFY